MISVFFQGFIFILKLTLSKNHIHIDYQINHKIDELETEMTLK